MIHHSEEVRRAAKAYKLCLAFESLCKDRKPRMKKSEMLKHAYAMEYPFWVSLSGHADINRPSPTTVSVTIGILAARAQVNV